MALTEKVNEQGPGGKGNELERMKLGLEKRDLGKWFGSSN